MSGGRHGHGGREKTKVRTAGGRPGPWLASAVGAAGAAALWSALGGGSLYDRVSVSPSFSPIATVVAMPACALIAWTAAALAFWNRPEQDTRAGGSRWAALCAAAFTGAFVWIEMSLLSAPYRYPGLMMMMTWGAAAACAAAVAWAARARRLQTGFAAAVVAAATIVAGLGLNEFAQSFRDGDTTWRVFSTFAMPNFLAGYLVITIPLAMALFLGAQNRSAAACAGLALALQVACLLLTQSRLGLMALAGGVLVFAVLALQSRVLTGAVRSRAAALALIVLFAGAVAARPVIVRLRAAGDQQYSARFRSLTWRGAAKMAAAHPLLGTGPATFPTAYGPYAEVGYTLHAHNSFLQLASEAGAPAALLALLGLCAALGVCVRAAHTARIGHRTVGHDARHPIDPRLLVAGAASAIAGSLVHNVFDSDLYVPAIAVGLGAAVGLAIASSRSVCANWRPQEPASGQAQSGADRWSGIRRAAGVLAFCLILVLSWRTISSRNAAYDAEAAIEKADGQRAAAGYEEAFGTEPGNAEYALSLSTIRAAMGDREGAVRACEAAVRAASTGKTHYRLARQLSALNEADRAVAEFQRSVQLDPNNAITLLYLTDALAAAKQYAEVDATLDRIARLYHSPVGQVRALPELVDVEYGIAFLAMAERSGVRNREALEQGVAILREFWRTRKSAMAISRPLAPELRTRAIWRLAWGLEQLIPLRREAGDARGAAELQKELEAVRAA